jgi:hypothetical protein
MHRAGKMHSFQMSQHVANVTTTTSDSVHCGSIVSCSCPEASCHEDVALGGVIPVLALIESRALEFRESKCFLRGPETFTEMNNCKHL